MGWMIMIMRMWRDLGQLVVMENGDEVLSNNQYWVQASFEVITWSVFLAKSS